MKSKTFIMIVVVALLAACSTNSTFVGERKQIIQEEGIECFSLTNINKPIYLFITNTGTGLAVMESGDGNHVNEYGTYVISMVCIFDTPYRKKNSKIIDNFIGLAKNEFEQSNAVVDYIYEDLVLTMRYADGKVLTLDWYEEFYQ